MKTVLASALFSLLMVTFSAAQEYECTFEDDAGPLSWGCDFTQSLSDELQWEINSGRTMSSNTGPSADHTKGTSEGKYYYVEASNIEPGYAAVVTSPSISTVSGQEYCLRFWYHMWGEDIGFFNVSTIQGGSPTQVWSESLDGFPDVGTDEWQEAEIDLTAAGSSMQLELVAVKGGTSESEPYGDIAVDDISVSRGACDAPVTASTAGTTTTTTTTTTAPTEPPTTTTTTTQAPTTITTEATTESTSSSSAAPSPSPSLASSPSPSAPPTDSGTKSTSMPSTKMPSTTKTIYTGPEAVEVDRLWGVGETVWLIIFAAVGVIVLLFIIVIIAQACQLSKQRKQANTSDLQSVVAYPPAETKEDNYIQAYDNLNMKDDNDLS